MGALNTIDKFSSPSVAAYLAYATSVMPLRLAIDPGAYTVEVKKRSEELQAMIADRCRD